LSEHLNILILKDTFKPVKEEVIFVNIVLWDDRMVHSDIFIVNQIFTHSLSSIALTWLEIWSWKVKWFLLIWIVVLLVNKSIDFSIIFKENNTFRATARAMKEELNIWRMLLNRRHDFLIGLPTKR
jgi:hypothetical protein